MNFDLPDEPDTFLITTNTTATHPSATAPAAATTSERGARPINMLVDLNLVSDSFMGFDGHDVLELQSFDVNMRPSSYMSLGHGPNTYADNCSTAYGIINRSSLTTFNSAYKRDSPVNRTFERRSSSNNNNQELFTISTSASPRESQSANRYNKPSLRPSSEDATNGGDGGGDASTTSASPTSVPPPSQQPAATTSTEDDRRKRHNANERKRTNALKTRILDMRDELSSLVNQRERLQEKSAATLTSKSSALALSSVTPANADFMEIVSTIDRLRSEKSHLKRQLQQWDMQNSTYQTIMTEYSGGIKRKKLKQRLENGQAHGAGGGAAASSDDYDDGDDIEDAMNAEDTPIFQKVLFGKPMALQDAMECVRSSYNEIMAFRNQREFDSLGGEVLGWRDRRLLNKHSLRFMLAQHFESALAQELVYKTWNLLTIKKLYQRIQPQTTELKILQRVNNDCVIVRLSVGTSSQMHHTILLIARGRIDGGFLITYRSIPLSEGKAAFAETEGSYVSIFNWFMFLDSRSPVTGALGCEVIFGGKVKNRSAEYLRYLMMEVVAGVVRWQTAVGYSKFRLTN